MNNKKKTLLAYTIPGRPSSLHCGPEINIQIEHNISFKNPNWREANQLAILQSVALERDLNLGPPDYKSGAPNHQTTLPQGTLEMLMCIFNEGC